MMTLFPPRPVTAFNGPGQAGGFTTCTTLLFSKWIAAHVEAAEPVPILKGRRHFCLPEPRVANPGSAACLSLVTAFETPSGKSPDPSGRPLVASQCGDRV